jgi:asparagine synthase (glutamine-hydrolysing)
MCGIAGGFRHNISEEQSIQVIRRLNHRGPDDNGVWQRENLWLAATRLAVQDLSPAGGQPMRTGDKNYYIVYNGELYNAPALREKLASGGTTFYTSCDTEIVLNAFIAWGPDCLQELEGDFALAIWNESKAELFIARDPMGVKPLYIYNDGNKLVFASEIKALLDLDGLDYSLRPEVFADYLTYLYSPSEKTPFELIHKLLPGHFLKLHLKKKISKPQQYYKIPMGTKETAKSREWRRGVEETLSGVVERQLYADVPVGIMLSGGLDSSLIAALARKASPDMSLQAFCIDAKGMDTEGFEEDIKYARQIAKHLGIPLQEVDGSIAPSATWIDEFVWQMDEPQADPAGWYTGLIADSAQRSGTKVLLSGTGGDDVFSGYRRHSAIKSFGVTSMLPKAASAVPDAMQRMMPRENPNLRRLGKLLSGSGLSPIHAAINSHFWASRETTRSIMGLDYLPPSNPYKLFEKLLDEIPEEKDLLQQMLFWEQRTFLPHHNLAYIDKMSMAHSVEVRVPFADRQIVSLAASMPASLKLKGKNTKAILRQVAKSYLPEEIINRSKTGFGAPLRQWTRGPLKSVIRERLLDDSLHQRGFFNKSAIETLITDNEKGKKDNAYTLFSLLCIESWLRQFAPSA